MRCLSIRRTAVLSFLRRSHNKMLSLTVVGAIFTGETMNGTPVHNSTCVAGEQESRQDFSSLGKEEHFWKKWLEHHDGYGVEPYFFSEDLQTPMDKRLGEVAKHSKVFVLVVVTSNENGIFRVLSLAKDETTGRWQQTKWELSIEGAMKESVAKAPAVQDDVLKTLSSNSVFVGESNSWKGTFDALSVFIFLKYQGKCSRLAIYNPTLDLGKQTPVSSVARALKSLLQSTGILAAEKT